MNKKMKLSFYKILENNANKIKLLKDLIKKEKDINNLFDESGTHIIFYAIALGHYDVVNFLMEDGIDINLRGFRGYSLLHEIIISQEFYDKPDESFKLIKKLIDKGIDVNIRDDFGITPLLLSIEKQRFDIANYFLQHGADINSKDICGRTLIHNFIANYVYTSEYYQLIDNKNYMEIIEFMIHNGAKPNTKDNIGQTPLATIGNSKISLKIAEYLISLGLDVDDRDVFGLSSVIYAWLEKSYDLLNLYLKYSKEISVSDVKKYDLLTFLECFLKDYDYKTINYIYNTSITHTPLHLAIDTNDIKVIDFFLKKGIYINARDENLMTPLHYAASNGNLEIVKFLVENGADINLTSWDNKAPIHTAWFFNSDLNIVHYLLYAGADITIENDEKEIINKINEAYIKKKK
ncbi:ankyrin repeat domain-containing protein [Deferribacter desulfuricans]|nr:ankyrin repeat domain-containing protein [Deferribacter desulfuricans]